MVNATVIGEELWKHLGASLTCRYQTRFDYVSFLVSGEVPAYWIMDAQVNYRFAKAGLVAKLGGTNVLNRGYYSLLGGPLIGGMYYLSLTWEPFR
jgi:iron complex outermembrane receptor protein